MIYAQNIKLIFGKQLLFNDVSFSIDQYDRIGLIGRNGSGKTTLLKAIINPSILNGGTISIQSGKRIAYMPQEVVLESELSILDEVLGAFPELSVLQQKIRELEKILEHASDPKSVEEYADALERYALLSPETLKAEAKKLLTGLGFSQDEFSQPVKKLSVGWKMRVVLAKLLLQNADFYLFDEPTNHLDLQTKEWFLEFLKRAAFGFMLICHERYFLDELCEKILEVEQGKCTWYDGNYSESLGLKERARKALESAYELQQKDIERRKATIARFKASASKASMAQSMMKQLEKMEKIEMPPVSKNVNFSFLPVPQSGRTVLTVKDVAHSFGDKEIFSNVSFEIERGQRVALIAPNGGGKTTLFNLIAGKLPLKHGSVIFGYNVAPAVFAQDQNQVLDPSATVLENIDRICGYAEERVVRSFLGAFLFSGDSVQKKVKVLSGGEKNRLGMVGVLLQKANLLLLDEPTNHLDIPSKEIVLRALREFAGTVLFVSHDRDFVNDLATSVIELTPRGAYCYQGNYDEFMYQKKAAEELLATCMPASNQSKSAVQPVINAKKTVDVVVASGQDSALEAKHLEKQIVKLNQQIKNLDHVFEEFSYGDPEFMKALTQVEQWDKDLKDAEKKLQALQQKH